MAVPFAGRIGALRFAIHHELNGGGEEQDDPGESKGAADTHDKLDPSRDAGQNQRTPEKAMGLNRFRHSRGGAVLRVCHEQVAHDHKDAWPEESRDPGQHATASKKLTQATNQQETRKQEVLPLLGVRQDLRRRHPVFTYREKDEQRHKQSNNHEQRGPEEPPPAAYEVKELQRRQDADGPQEGPDDPMSEIGQGGVLLGMGARGV
jgi:hypothetical protein